MFGPQSKAQNLAGLTSFLGPSQSNGVLHQQMETNLELFHCLSQQLCLFRALLHFQCTFILQASQAFAQSANQNSAGQQCKYSPAEAQVSSTDIKDPLLSPSWVSRRSRFWSVGPSNRRAASKRSYGATCMQGLRTYRAAF